MFRGTLRSVIKSRSLLRCIAVLEVGTGACYRVKSFDVKHSGSLSIDGQPLTPLIKVEDSGGKEQNKMVLIRWRKVLAAVFTTTDGSRNISTSLCTVVNSVFSFGDRQENR